MLDELQGKMSVNWRWVEGHKDTEGYIQADDLAKKEVLEEGYFWQETAFGLYMRSTSSSEEKHSEVVDKLNQPTCSDITRKPDVQEKKCLKYICKPCNITCKENNQGIKCQECKYWAHYKCSSLPDYRLYPYESTQRRYT